MKCSLVIKTNQPLIHATAQMNHTHRVMNESCQTSKRTHCAMPFIELKNRKNQSNVTDQRFLARAVVLAGACCGGTALREPYNVLKMTYIMIWVEFIQVYRLVKFFEMYTKDLYTLL